MLLSILTSRRLPSPSSRHLLQAAPEHLCQLSNCCPCFAGIVYDRLPPLVQSRRASEHTNGTKLFPPVSEAFFPAFHTWTHSALGWQRCNSSASQRSLIGIMAKPVARWRRSGPRDSIGIQRGAEASPPPGSSTPSDNQEPNIPRTFSSFRTQGIASTTQEPGTSPSREDGLLGAASGFGPAGFSTQSPSVGGSGGVPAHNLGAPDGSRGNFGPPVSHAPTGSDPQSAISVLFGNRGLEAFNKLTLDDEYILHFYGVRQTVYSA